MPKLIRVSITETGGEFTCGPINDEDLISSIKKTIDNGDLKSSCVLENGEDFDAVMYDESFHLYGPNIRGAEVIIEETSVKNDSEYDNPDDLEFNEIFDGSIDESGINIFTTSCPGHIDVEDSKLVIYTKKYEKRINATYYIRLNDEEIFDPKNIYIGFILLDEVMDYVEDEILEHFLYIPKNTFESYLKSALKSHGQEFDEKDLEKDYDFEESMQEEIWGFDLTEKIKEKHKISSYSIEGKGEWENDYLQILNSEEEVLFEAGAY